LLQSYLLIEFGDGFAESWVNVVGNDFAERTQYEGAFVEQRVGDYQARR
jgi:hypothetical protein